MTRETHPLRVAIVAAERELRRLSAERDAALIEAVTWEGMTYRDASEVFGVSVARVGQIVARERSKVTPDTPAQRLERAREAFRNAVHAQQLREERETGGNATERRAFYGDPDESPADVVEAPIRWKGFYETDEAARVRYEDAG